MMMLMMLMMLIMLMMVVVVGCRGLDPSMTVATEAAGTCIFEVSRTVSIATLFTQMETQSTAVGITAWSIAQRCTSRHAHSVAGVRAGLALTAV